MEDREQITTIAARDVRSLAVSKDGRWVAAGTAWGDVGVWNAKTYQNVFSHRGDNRNNNGVDFSPDSTRLVAASNYTATIWDIGTRKKVLTLGHENFVEAATYSPYGDRIATATGYSVRLWNSNGGRLLADIPVTVTPAYNTGLLWLNDHLFAVSKSAIREIEASTGSTVSEMPVPYSSIFSCIALPKHGDFIAYSTQGVVTFWDTVTHTQLGLVQHPQDIRSLAVSPDDRFLAIGGYDGSITINSLSHIVVSILSR